MVYCAWKPDRAKDGRMTKYELPEGITLAALAELIKLPPNEAMDRLMRVAEQVKAAREPTPVDELATILGNDKDEDATATEAAGFLNRLSLPTPDTAGDLEWEPQAWVVPDMIPANEITLITGRGGTGKSRLIGQILFAVCTGSTSVAEKVGIKATAQGETRPIVMLNMDDSHREIVRRTWYLVDRNPDCGPAHGAKADGKHSAPLGWNVFSRTSLRRVVRHMYGRDLHGNPGLLGGWRMAKRLMEAHDPHERGVLVLDPLSSFFAGNENDRGEVDEFMTAVSEFADCGERAVILLAHPAKQDRGEGSEYSGNTAWLGNSRAAMKFSQSKVARLPKDEQPDAGTVLTTARDDDADPLKGETFAFTYKSAKSLSAQSKKRPYENVYKRRALAEWAAERGITVDDEATDDLARTLAHFKNQHGPKLKWSYQQETEAPWELASNGERGVPA